MYSTFFENNFLCMGNWALQGQAFLLWQIYQIMTVVLPNLQYGISICKKRNTSLSSFIIHSKLRTYASSAHTFRKQITVKTWLFLYLCMLFYLLTNVKHAFDKRIWTKNCWHNDIHSGLWGKWTRKLWPIRHW